jgi:hypothetical protein
MRSQVVTVDDFIFKVNEGSEVHRQLDEHDMAEEIAMCCRIAA